MVHGFECSVKLWMMHLGNFSRVFLAISAFFLALPIVSIKLCYLFPRVPFVFQLLVNMHTS